jgi:hypothetical protein
VVTNLILNYQPHSFRNNLFVLVLASLQHESDFAEIMSQRDQIPSQHDDTDASLK